MLFSETDSADFRLTWDFQEGQDLFQKNKILKLNTICTLCVAAWCWVKIIYF